MINNTKKNAYFMGNRELLTCLILLDILKLAKNTRPALHGGFLYLTKRGRIV